PSCRQPSCRRPSCRRPSWAFHPSVWRPSPYLCPARRAAGSETGRSPQSAVGGSTTRSVPPDAEHFALKRTESETYVLPATARETSGGLVSGGLVTRERSV